MGSLSRLIVYGISCATFVLVGADQPFSEAHVKTRYFQDVSYWSQDKFLPNSLSREFLVPTADSFPKQRDTDIPPIMDVDIPIVIDYVPPKSYQENKGGRIVSSDRSLRGDEGGPKYPIVVLSPDHPQTIPAEVITQSMTLFWYLSRPTKASIVFNIFDPEEKVNSWKETIHPPDEDGFKAGLQGIPLDKFGVKLVPGVSYRWSATIDEHRVGRAKNPYSSAGVRLVKNPIGFDPEALGKQDDLGKAEKYANNGYWYDAFMILTNLIKAYPGNCKLVKLRSSLLEGGMVNLDVVAQALNEQAGCS